MKRVFAILCAVLVMVCAVVPCFASGWNVESPVYGSANNVWVGAPQDASLEYMRLQAQEAVQKAYELGMFGGLYPVAIFVRSTNSGDAFCIQVMTPMGNTQGGMSSNGIVPSYGSQKFNGYEVGQNGMDKVKYADRIYLQNSESISGSQNSSWCVWTLRKSGDWTPSFTGTSANYIPLSSSALTTGEGVTKLMVVMNPHGGVPFYWFDYPVNSSYKTGWSKGTPIGATLDDVLAKYDEQIALLNPAEEDEPVGTVVLDVPAIFDGMFNGMRSVLGAFDLEIFGISIVGMLVAFIVIAVVAFIVRKLWK